MAAPPHFVCPITMEPFWLPVLASDGNFYEKTAILEWAKTHGTSPLTRAPLTGGFTYSYAFSTLLNAWRAEHGLPCAPPPKTGPSEDTFVEAVLEGRADDVAHYIAAGVPQSHLDTALCQTRDLAMIRRLVEAGADVHIDVDFPLREAASRLDLEAVQYLVEAGADIHADNEHALAAAACGGPPSFSLLLYVLTHTPVVEEEEVLLCAAETGYVPALRALVKHGATPTLRAVAAAARGQHLDAVKYLVSLL